MPTDLERSALAAAKLAVQQDPTAAEAVENCRAALADQVPDGQQIALLVGWAYLALDEPTEAWECFRAAVSYETEPHLTDRAALLAGLLAARNLEAPALAGAWYRASAELIAVLDQINFTDDLTTHFTDDLIWPDHPELRADVLPHLVRTLDARSRSLMALTLYAVHHAYGAPEAAVRAAWQVVHLGELAYWLGDKETALHWYQYTLDHTDLPVLVEEAEQRMAELLAG